MTDATSMRPSRRSTTALVGALALLGLLSGTGQAQTDKPGVKRFKAPDESERSLRFLEPSGFFTIDYPDNWRTFRSGRSVSMGPPEGIVTPPGGAPVLVYGVVIGHYSPFAGAGTRRKLSLRHHYTPFEDTTRARGALEDITDDLVRQILAAKPYLRADDGSAQPETIDGAPGFTVPLTGRSPVTNEAERARLLTRSLPDGHVIYVLSMAPAREYDALQRAVARIMRTLVVNDDAVHPAVRQRPAVGTGKSG